MPSLDGIPYKVKKKIKNNCTVQESKSNLQGCKLKISLIFYS